MSQLSKTIALWADIVLTAILLAAFWVTRDTYYGIGAILASIGLVVTLQLRTSEALHEHLEVVEERLSEQLAKKDEPKEARVETSGVVSYVPREDDPLFPHITRAMNAGYELPKRRDLRGDV